MILGDMSTGALVSAGLLALCEGVSRLRRLPAPWLLRLALMLVCGLVAYLMSCPFRGGDPAAFFYDDFYYYLIPARNFIETGSFYFYPGVPTNGFQPLWMVVIVALSAMAGPDDFAFFVLFSLSIAALILLAYVQAYRLLRDHGAPPIYGVYAGAAVVALQVQIAAYGLEVVLTLPLLLAFTRAILARPLATLTPKGAGWLGFIGSLVALSRLDSLVLLLPLALIVVLRDRPSPRMLGCVVLGALPLWTYFAVNYAVMDIWLPISGQAKMLRDSWLPNLKPFIFKGMLGYSTLAAVFSAAVLAGAWQWLRFRRARRASPTAEVQTHARGWALLAAAFLGVVLYYGSYLFLTDWKLWFWYFYPMGWVAVLAILGMYWAKCPSWAVMLPVLCLYIPVYSVFFYDAQAKPLYQKALVMRAAAKLYPGRYAMGDSAGTTAYVMNQPLLQTEGLVGDKTYLDFIRHEAPIAEMLRHYSIDYYIASTGAQEADGCYHLREPSMAGPGSHVMRGTVCARPLAEFGSSKMFRARDVRE